MTHIRMTDFCADFQVYTSKGRSIKLNAINMMTGGLIQKNDAGVTIVRAINNITLTVAENERIALLGHNGAGKSTLLRVLSGVYAPTSGTIDVDGVTTSLIDISFGIDPEASGRDNIFIRGTMMGIKRSQMAQLADEIISFSELGDFIELPVRTYSSGMHFRLAFSVATVLQPEILLMDEWLSVGDASFRDKADAKMQELVGRSKIMVIATHDRNTAEGNCQRAIWMERGEIKMDGPCKEVCAAYWGD